MIYETSRSNAMNTIRVGRRHIFYRALDLLTSCTCTDLSGARAHVNQGVAIISSRTSQCRTKYSASALSTCTASTFTSVLGNAVEYELTMPGRYQGDI